jgi:hypothetical protein
MMATEAAPQLTGAAVTVSYVSDPVVGHGQFRLDNPGSSSLRAAVESAWLEVGGDRQTLSDVSIYDLDHEAAIDSSDFEVEPGATRNFLVGFPARAQESRFGESTAVGLRLQLDGATKEAVSPIIFERRIPRGG